MFCKNFGKVIRMSGLGLCIVALGGCSTFEFGAKPDFGYTWVSEQGKTREQLIADQTDCRRDMSRASSPGLSGVSGAGGGTWDNSDYRSFDRCMRAKGWVKQ